MTDAAKNTDREIWRATEGDYYSPSIHVTTSGGIGINVGGTVIVKPVQEWHRLALQSQPAPKEAMMANDKELIERLYQFALDESGVTDDVVELAARAAFNVWWDNRGDGAEATWLVSKGKWVREARAALEAVLQPPAGEREVETCANRGDGDAYDLTDIWSEKRCPHCLGTGQHGGVKGGPDRGLCSYCDGTGRAAAHPAQDKASEWDGLDCSCGGGSRVGHKAGCPEDGSHPASEQPVVDDGEQTLITTGLTVVTWWGPESEPLVTLDEARAEIERLERESDNRLQRLHSAEAEAQDIYIAAVARADAAESRVKALEDALGKIAEGEGVYGAQAFEYKHIAREALAQQGGQTDG